MTPPFAPVPPHRPGGPSRVIQGSFPGGQPRLARPAAAPLSPAPMVARPATMPPAAASGRPRPVQPAARPRPILPNAPRPSAVQPSGGDAFAVPPGFQFRPSALGQRLPEPVQQKMETFFGASFADVRVHVGNEAASIGALAFTIGSDLYFAPGQYNPQTIQGQQLLGHELTHVVQQRAGRVRNPLGTGVAVVQDPALEAEAERMGMRAAMSPAPIQAKPAAVGLGVAPSGATKSTAGGPNAVIFPAGPPAHSAAQLKPAPIIPGHPANQARGTGLDPFPFAQSAVVSSMQCKEKTIAPVERAVAGRVVLDTSFHWNNRGATAVIQRLTTPNLPQKIYTWASWGKPYTKDQLRPLFRNTLVLLRSQLRLSDIPATGTAEKNRLLALVDSFIDDLNANRTILPATLDAVINQVNGLTAGLALAQPSNLRPLNAGEQLQFDALIDHAVLRATTARDHPNAIEQTFHRPDLVAERNTTIIKATANFNLIITHLNYWKNRKLERVQINTAAAGFGGYNKGQDDDSHLVINQNAFANQNASANTLIHEASHGRVHTRDLGYIGAPYFFTLEDRFRLDNADHYSFATQLAHNEAVVPAIAGAGAATLMDKFQTAKSLAYYKADRIWTYLMWAKDSYAGQNYVPNETKQGISRWLGLKSKGALAGLGAGGLTDPWDDTDIDKEHVGMLVQLYSSMKGYLVKDMNYAANSATSIAMIPTDGSRTLTAAGLDINQTIDEMSVIIFKTYAGFVGLPDHWDVNKVGLKLFRRLFVKRKDLAVNNQPAQSERDLYQFLGGVL